MLPDVDCKVARRRAAPFEELLAEPLHLNEQGSPSGFKNIEELCTDFKNITSLDYTFSLQLFYD